MLIARLMYRDFDFGQWKGYLALTIQILNCINFQACFTDLDSCAVKYELANFIYQSSSSDLFCFSTKNQFFFSEFELKICLLCYDDFKTRTAGWYHLGYDVFKYKHLKTIIVFQPKVKKNSLMCDNLQSQFFIKRTAWGARANEK